jgi:predicted Zn finger-like uncharacterized protein
MDVRCERCKSQYEVEDANVSDLGTEVQCSDCGHQFMVKRPGTKAPGASPTQARRESDGEEAGAWTIETHTGRSLHLRDLTTLHKWIIERRAGRNDRLWRGGDPWQRLGDMTELAPFFDIMDSAERAHSADTPLPVAPPPLVLPVREPPVPQPFQPQRRPLDPAPLRLLAAAPARAANGSLPSSRYDAWAEKTVIVRVEPAKPRIVLKLLITMLVAAIVAYAGILWQHHRRTSVMVPPAAPAEATSAAATTVPAPATA